jgi:hypothetical protein
MGQAARQRYVEQHSFESFAQRMHQLLRHVYEGW